MNLLTKILDSLDIAFDFWGPNPHGFIILYILFTESFDIDRGSEAIENRFGVTWLTLSSVHCADKRTAISKVKLSWWSRGIGVSG